MPAGCQSPQPRACRRSSSIINPFRPRGLRGGALDAKLEAFKIDLVACAGFMRIMSPAFVERWRDRMLNIHPSLLPAFKGLNTHARALAAGVKITGCTVHLVRPEVDEWPHRRAGGGAGARRETRRNARRPRAGGRAPPLSPRAWRFLPPAMWPRHYMRERARHKSRLTKRKRCFDPRSRPPRQTLSSGDRTRQNEAEKPARVDTCGPAMLVIVFACRGAHLRSSEQFKCVSHCQFTSRWLDLA